MLVKFFTVFFAFGLNLSVIFASSTLKIQIFAEQATQQAELIVMQGSYTILSEDVVVGSLKKSDKIKLKREGNQVVVLKGTTTLAQSKKITLRREGWQSQFKLAPTSPAKAGRVYPDNLIITAAKGSLLCLNHVDINKYIDGVIEAESGGKQNLEYYKVQATISRTYALNQMHKHAHQGFNLCDQVHCQVYKGRSNSSPFIPEAVKQTEGLVIVDADLRLISAVFHANCGGQTLNSENVWTYPLPYLKAKRDTFCFNRKQSNWVKTINKNDWVNYLEKKFNYPVSDTLMLQAVFKHTPLEHKRELYLTNINSN
ncbi:MAG: SpoIID/LytB domain-containing protein, partial [Luteibaculaceae bacterium]